jgi:1,4-dihydroxy-2-naphthoate octaprenyltransferase
MPLQIKYVLANLIRALRLPFISVSIFPFIFGFFIEISKFNLPVFILGLIVVSFAHLSANLMNDFCDSKSGADWKDINFYGFFGGSKLIQEGIFRQGFYLKTSFFCAGVSLFSVLFLALILKNSLIISIYILVIFLGWQYTARPLRFSYNYLGELFVFILFGPVSVMGGYFIQTGIFPDARSFMLSLPFGFLTLSILIANEIPDFIEDKKTGKNNWVGLVGEKKAFLLYYCFVFLAIFFIFLCVQLKYMNTIAFLSVFLIPLAIKAGIILKRNFNDKVELIKSSKLAISLQGLISLLLILSIII